MNHNIEAEQAVLGAIIGNNEALHHAEGLKAEHFYHPVHAEIFKAIVGLVDVGSVATPITLRDKVNCEPAYLAKLLGLSASFVNVHLYSRSIIDLALGRKLTEICRETIEDTDSTVSAIEKQEQLEKKLFALAENDVGGFKHIASAADMVIARAEIAHTASGELLGIDTGLKDVNSVLCGLQAPDLIILAGRPSMGKTALATNMCKNAAQRGYKVGKFSLEMSAEQLTARMISTESGVPFTVMSKGMFNTDQFRALVDARDAIKRLPIHIDDTPALSISALRSRARRMKRKHGLDLLMVDYLQLCTTGAKGANRVQEVSEITQGLKAIAKELHIPVIALSQLSRKVEEREDKRPQLSDLRESGSIEQDADIVMFVYREEYYVERNKPDENSPKYVDWLTKIDACKGKAELIVAKHRNGPTANIELQFKGATTAFHDKDDGLPYYSAV